MKAAIRKKYGAPEVLTIEEVRKPIPKKNEVLIQIFASTVNRTDCGVLWGEPFVFRFFTGLFSPRYASTGTDFAGIIEAIGSEVTNFKVGDKVWGFNDEGIGSHAEYLVLPENEAILHIPEGFSFEEAVAAAEGFHYALNFINKVKLTPQHHVLVNGATGGIGSAAVQLLKHYGVMVTAVCRTEHIELVKSLGANRVIDYQKEDFTLMKDTKYHFVFDAVGKSTFGKCKEVLLKDGIYISSELGPRSENLFRALFSPFLGNPKVIFPLPTNIKKSMMFAKSLMEKGEFKPVIDRRYPLSQIREAFTYVRSGQKIGNVVLTISDPLSN